MTIDVTPQASGSAGPVQTPGLTHPGWCDPRTCEAEINGSYSHRSTPVPIEPVPYGEDAWTAWLIEYKDDPHPPTMVVVRAERRWPATGEVETSQTYALELESAEDFAAKVAGLVATARATGKVDPC